MCQMARSGQKVRPFVALSREASFLQFLSHPTTSAISTHDSTSPSIILHHPLRIQASHLCIHLRFQQLQKLDLLTTLFSFTRAVMAQSRSLPATRLDLKYTSEVSVLLKGRAGSDPFLTSADMKRRREPRYSGQKTLISTTTPRKCLGNQREGQCV